MHVTTEGEAASPIVYSCTIKNNSRIPVRVWAVYKAPPMHVFGSQEEVSTTDLPPGDSVHMIERPTTHGPYQARKRITLLKFTRMDGRKQKLMAPFYGVQRAEHNWLFVIDDWQVLSLNPRAIAAGF